MGRDFNSGRSFDATAPEEFRRVSFTTLILVPAGEELLLQCPGISMFCFCC